MTSCRYWPSAVAPARSSSPLSRRTAATGGARRPWMAVWLKTHWISRPGVTTWSNGQTGRSNQRWTPVIGEARKALESGQSRQPIAHVLRNQAQNPVERDGEDHEVGGDLLARAQDHAADRAVVDRPRWR